MRNIKISEEQNQEIKKLIKEQLNPNGGLSLKYNTPNGKTPKNAGEIGNAVVAATKAADKVPNSSSVDNSVTISADPDNDNKKQDITIGSDSTVSESLIISKSQVDKLRLMKLKENTQVVKIKDFLK